MPTRRGSSARLLRTLVLCTACGAALQFPISWLAAGIAMWADPPSGSGRAAWVAHRTQSRMDVRDPSSEDAQSRFRVFQRRGLLGRSTVMQWGASSSGPIENAPRVFKPRPPEQLPDLVEPRYRDSFRGWLNGIAPIPGAPFAMLEHDSFGFPLQAMGYAMRTDYAVETVSGAPSFVPVFAISGGIDASVLTRYRTPRPALVLPLVPRWPEFLINTAAWGAALWLVTSGASLFRRARRRRRGLCPACGYDRRGLPDTAACPECGRGRVATPCPPAVS